MVESERDPIEELTEYINQFEIETKQAKHWLKQLVLRKDNRKKSLPVATQEKPI